VSDIIQYQNVFVSYAWGGRLERKEWFRHKGIDLLDSMFSTFWDRDCIQYGQTIDETIAQALTPRPLVVLCFCDIDYCDAARTRSSGLWREIKMLERIADQGAVRIVAALLDKTCTDMLPRLLRRRAYVDLTELTTRDLYLGNVLASVVLGASQTYVQTEIAEIVEAFELRRVADEYFAQRPLHLTGNGRTHEVSRSDGSKLLPPEWMRSSSRWSRVVSENEPDFSPMRGVWHWDHWTPSLGMRALGTTICAAFFPDKTAGREIAAIERCGNILASAEFSMIKKTEPFFFDADDLMKLLLSSSEGIRELKHLLVGAVAL
jgi:hypothetical protein